MTTSAGGAGSARRFRHGRGRARGGGSAERGVGAAGGGRRRRSGRRGGGAGGRAGAPALEPLDPGQERRHRRIDLGGGGLDQHELELDPRLGAVGRRLERGRDEVEQPDGVGLGQRLRLLEQPPVALGGDAQLGRDLAEHLHGEQLAPVDLEVAEHLAGVAAGLGQRRGGAQRGGRIAGDDRVDGAEQLLGVGDARAPRARRAGSIRSSPA